MWLTVAACSAAPVPSPTPTPTPTAISTPSAQELLDRMMTALLGLETVRFSLTHEAGGTDLGGGLLLTSVEGEALFPDRASLNATAAFSALRVNLGIGIVQIGDKAYRQDPLNRSWEEVVPASLPFLFAGMNRSVAEAMAASEQVNVIGIGEMDATAVYMLSGSVLSETLRGLVPAVGSGQRLQWEVAMGVDDALPRSLRIQGTMFSADTPEMARVLVLSDFDEPVVIEPPPG
jgi:hypothetical protein